MTNYRNIFSE